MSTELFFAVYALVGIISARYYARWSYRQDDEDYIGIFICWSFGMLLWPLINAIVGVSALGRNVPGGVWLRLLVASPPKRERKEQELEKRRARVRELEAELEL